MAKPVSQSRTMWVKKGTIVNGKEVKKGYVAQYGKPEKRVTNRVRLEVATPKRGEAGDVVRLKKGRYVQPGGGASKPGTRNVSPASSSGRGGDQTPAKTVKAAAGAYAGKGRGAMERARVGQAVASRTAAAGRRRGAESARLSGQAAQARSRAEALRPGTSAAAVARRPVGGRGVSNAARSDSRGNRAKGPAGWEWDALLTAASFIPGLGLAGGAMKAARVAQAGKAAGAGARAGVSAAGKAMAGEARPAAAAKTVTKPAAKPVTKPKPAKKATVKKATVKKAVVKKAPAKKAAVKKTAAKKTAAKKK